MKTLKKGDQLPQFSAIKSYGTLFESQSIVGKKALVIYFYPKDDTPGCTIEACSFRDAYEQFTDYGAEVVGISADSEKSHSKFKEKYKLPFILLSDEKNKIRKLFGVPNDLFGLLPGRATYVIDKNGIIQLVFDSVASKIHIKKALDILKEI